MPCLCAASCRPWRRAWQLRGSCASSCFLLPYRSKLPVRALRAKCPCLVNMQCLRRSMRHPCWRLVPRWPSRWLLQRRRDRPHRASGEPPPCRLPRQATCGAPPCRSGRALARQAAPSPRPLPAPACAGGPPVAGRGALLSLGQRPSPRAPASQHHHGCAAAGRSRQLGHALCRRPRSTAAGLHKRQPAGARREAGTAPAPCGRRAAGGGLVPASSTAQARGACCRPCTTRAAGRA